MAIREHWTAFLAGLPQPEGEFQLVDAGKRLARETASLKYPVEVIIKIYRTALQSTWSYLTGFVSELPDDAVNHAEVLIYFWDRAGRWIDNSIGVSIDIFHTERARLTASASAKEFEAVRDILAGEDVDLKKASATLGGYPLSVFHTAFIVDTSDPDAVSDLAKVGNEIGRELRAAQPLVVHPGGRRIWVWAGTRSEPHLSLLDKVDTLARAHKVRVFAGTPTAGLEGFVASFRDAERVREVAQRGSVGDGLMRYDTHEVIALLGCTPDVDRFMRRTLGDMLQSGENFVRMRETVTALLENAGSVEDAAKQLCVHRNTVRYRLSRAEEVLGRPVTKCGPELVIALRHQQSFHDDLVSDTS
ncbi:hypothetical protein ASG90_13500 [Nocardioides sp. Soil797]|nr:hypothetical protein ASG90_13500 [Nocardioides sp. Soil797]